MTTIKRIVAANAPTSTASSTGSYVTVTGDYEFRVSRRLREDYDNGRVYYRRAAKDEWKKHEERLKRKFIERR